MGGGTRKYPLLYLSHMDVNLIGMNTQVYDEVWKGLYSQAEGLFG